MRTLLDSGHPHAAERELFDGEYFIQKVEWKDLRAQRADSRTSFWD